MEQVLRYAEYTSEDRNSRVYCYSDFCGKCLLELPKPAAGSPGTPDQITPSLKLSFDGLERNEFRFFAFCPWCGCEFASEWWKGQALLNKRTPDHFLDPGTHAGDVNEFAGFTSENHWLSTSDGSPCWCRPDITAHVDGCVISHRNVPRGSA
jgi:hypothetical protein